MNLTQLKQAIAYAEVRGVIPEREVVIRSHRGVLTSLEGARVGLDVSSPRCLELTIGCIPNEVVQE